MKKGEKKGLASLPLDRLIEEAFHPAKVMQSDYEKILDNWRSVFPKEQFFTCFYDQIIDEPGKLSSDLCEFLGVPSPDWPVKGERINASSDKDFPPELRSVLTDYYREPVRRLSEKEGGYFSTWLERYEAF